MEQISETNIKENFMKLRQKQETLRKYIKEYKKTNDPKLFQLIQKTMGEYETLREICAYYVDNPNKYSVSDKNMTIVIDKEYKDIEQSNQKLQEKLSELQKMFFLAIENLTIGKNDTIPLEYNIVELENMIDKEKQTLRQLQDTKMKLLEETGKKVVSRKQSKSDSFDIENIIKSISSIFS